MVGSSHVAGVLSFSCPPLKICNFLDCSYFYFFESSRGKGSNPHCYAKGKAGSFWQRKVTLTKYFANHLLTNCYPRLKRRHITTLKIVCSTAQPRKALARVRAVKDLFQNSQRDNWSSEYTTRGTLKKGGKKKPHPNKQTKNPTHCYPAEENSEESFKNHLYLHQYAEKKES